MKKRMRPKVGRSATQRKRIYHVADGLWTNKVRVSSPWRSLRPESSGECVEGTDLFRPSKGIVIELTKVNKFSLIE